MQLVAGEELTEGLNSKPFKYFSEFSLFKFKVSKSNLSYISGTESIIYTNI